MKALILGCGKSGESAAYLLIKKGWDVCLHDDNPVALNALAAKLQAEIYKKKPIKAFDKIIVSPLAYYSPFAVRLREKGITLESEIDLACEYAKCKKLAVTGSNGKTTVVTLIAQMLSAKGRALAVGNTGLPFSEVCDDLLENDYAIVEMSSFQLEASESFHPSAALITNITPDHIDVHKNMEEYIAAKKKIYKNLTKEDTAVFNADASEAYMETCARKLYYSVNKKTNGAYFSDGKLFYQDSVIIKQDELKIKGMYNISNALAAIAVAANEGADQAWIREKLLNFGGIAHRREICGSREGVVFINDSKATNPDAALKCLESLKGNIVMILGGSGKCVDFSLLTKKVAEKKATLLVYGEAAEEIRKNAESVGVDKIILIHNPSEGAEIGFNILRGRKGVVALSPACASFDMFKNYEERGDSFRAAVKEIIGRWQ